MTDLGLRTRLKKVMADSKSRSFVEPAIIILVFITDVPSSYALLGSGGSRHGSTGHLD